MHSQGWGGGKGKTWVCKDHVLPFHYCCEFPSSGLIGSRCYGYNVYFSYIAAKLKYVINMNYNVFSSVEMCSTLAINPLKWALYVPQEISITYLSPTNFCRLLHLITWVADLTDGNIRQQKCGWKQTFLLKCPAFEWTPQIFLPCTCKHFFTGQPN